jgi:hypothetical protein
VKASVIRTPHTGRRNSQADACDIASHMSSFLELGNMVICSMKGSVQAAFPLDEPINAACHSRAAAATEAQHPRIPCASGPIREHAAAKVPPKWGYPLATDFSTAVYGTFYGATGTGVQGTTPFTGLMYFPGTDAPVAASAAQVVGVIGATAVTNATNATAVPASGLTGTALPSGIR